MEKKLHVPPELKDIEPKVRAVATTPPALDILPLDMLVFSKVERLVNAVPPFDTGITPNLSLLKVPVKSAAEPLNDDVPAPTELLKVVALVMAASIAA